MELPLKIPYLGTCLCLSCQGAGDGRDGSKHRELNARDCMM
jgi:hypothetical protein